MTYVRGAYYSHMRFLIIEHFFELRHISYEEFHEILEIF